jgi:hypothetical protein
MRELHENKYVSPYGLALIETGIGNKDKAFMWLDRAYQERAGALPFVKVDPRLAPLRSDPRFHSLLRRLGLGSWAFPIDNRTPTSLTLAFPPSLWARGMNHVNPEDHSMARCRLHQFVLAR